VSEPQHPSKAKWKWPAPAKSGAGRFMRRGIVCGILPVGVSLLVAATASPPPDGLVYRDGPPPGFSGGFGEDHCQACHFGDKVNARPGMLTISAPKRYLPGETYPVAVTLTRPGMVVGGFELTSRFEKGGAQAGTMSFANGEGDQERVKLMTDRGVQYAHHSRAGTRLTARNVARWTVRWTAPASGGIVLFHAAANAANEDDSQFGDYIYTAMARSVATEASRARRSR
jgi:hypothetical protein